MSKKIKNKTDGIHNKIFINQNGETLICKGRLDFLKAVDEMGSISAAARRMNYSYKKAWSLIEKTNRAAGVTIVETLSGGAGGGGARLTAEGKKLIEIYQKLLNKNQIFENKMWNEFKKEFPFPF